MKRIDRSLDYVDNLIHEKILEKDKLIKMFVFNIENDIPQGTSTLDFILETDKEIGNLQKIYGELVYYSQIYYVELDEYNHYVIRRK